RLAFQPSTTTTKRRRRQVLRTTHHHHPVINDRDGEGTLRYHRRLEQRPCTL
ncbi:hypothetical protein ACJ72_08604, partial [Emergomyces africanus]